MERRWGGLDTAGTWWRRALRFLSGTVVMIAFREGVGALATGTAHESLFRFVCYLLLGLGGALIAPWLFVSIGLAEREQDKARETRRILRQDHHTGTDAQERRS